MNVATFDIKRFAIHDGPGTRTTLFLKGCSLRCAWCHNPESIGRAPEILFYAERCRGCGACVEVCPPKAHCITPNGHTFESKKCRACFRCTEVCPAKAVERCGQSVAIEEVMEELVADRVFFNNSGGGVTISGGEPLLQIGAVLELIRQLKAERIRVAVDTAGHVAAAVFRRFLAAPVAPDLVLFDLKAGTDALHKRLTGAPLTRILANLRALDGSDMPYWIRVPLIPGSNDDPTNLKAMAAIIASLGNRAKVDILPYHEFGSHKYERLHQSYALSGIKSPSTRRVERVRTLLSGERANCSVAKTA